jgi:hypothetical protein
MAHLQTDLSNRQSWRDLTDLLGLAASDGPSSEREPINPSHNKAEYPTQETGDIMLAGVEG